MAGVRLFRPFFPDGDGDNCKGSNIDRYPSQGTRMLFATLMDLYSRPEPRSSASPEASKTQATEREDD
jgi:hypothetical protein